MSKALKEEFTEVNDSLEDGASEILNMIFGGARTALDKLGDYKVVMNIPTIVKGDNVNIDFLTPTPALILKFNTECGQFHIQIGIEEDE